MDERCVNTWPSKYKEELVNSSHEVILKNQVLGGDNLKNTEVITLGSHPVTSSPVTNLYSQRKSNLLSRRSRSSKAYESIQGAPCRNLPDLVSMPQSKKNQREESFHLEVPASSNKDPLDTSNPFLHLFKDHHPGQVAFAFYVADCWFSFSDSNILPDLGQFLTQCHKWWVTLPTPYKRGYWTKEMQYKNKMGIEMEMKNRSPRRKKMMVLSKEKPKIVSQNLSLKSTIIDSKMSSTKNTREAFMIFVRKNMANVTHEMPGASGRKIRHELGKRWNSMDEVEKEKFADVISEENRREEECITGQTQIQYEEKYESKDELKLSPCNLKKIDVMTCDENLDESGTPVEFHESTVNITVEEIEEFAINANYYIEEDTSMS